MNYVFLKKGLNNFHENRNFKWRSKSQIDEYENLIDMNVTTSIVISDQFPRDHFFVTIESYLI